MNEGATLIEDLLILAAGMQSGTEVVAINLIDEIKRRKPNWPPVSVSHLIDDMDSRGLGLIRAPQDDPGAREFLINSFGVTLARQAKDRRSLWTRIRKNILPALNASVALVGALAAVAAAYFSYLGLPAK